MTDRSTFIATSGRHVFDEFRGILYSIGTGGITRWDAATGTFLPMLSVPGSLSGLALGPAGNTLFVGSSTLVTVNGQQMLVVYRVDHGGGGVTPVLIPPQPSEDGVVDVAVSGQSVLFTTSYNGSGPTPLRQFPTFGTDPAVTTVPGIGLIGAGSDLISSPGGAFVLILDPGNTAAGFALYSRNEQRVIAYSEDRETSSSGFNGGWGDVTDAGLIAISTTFPPATVIYDRNLNVVVDLTSRYAVPAVRDVQFSSDGHHLFVLLADSDTVEVYRTSDWTVVGTLAVGRDVPTASMFSAAGRIDVIDDDGLMLVSTATGVVVLDLNARLETTSIGTANVDELFGTAGSDQMSGLGGNDVLTGGDGDDVLDGGDGDDLLIGQGGVDVLRGGDGADRLYAGFNVNVSTADDDGNELYGGAGDDTLVSGVGRDLLDGGDGDDILSSGRDADGDTLLGGAGRDLLAVQGDLADAGADDDEIRIDGHGSEITGGTGADLFVTWASINSPNLSLGHENLIRDYNQAEGDRLDFSSIGFGATRVTFRGDIANAVFIRELGAVYSPNDFGPGYVQIWTWFDGARTWVMADVDQDGRVSADDLHLALDGNVVLTAAGFSANSLDPILGGTTGDDVWVGTAAAETYFGFAGDDDITGGGGGDELFGGSGDDVIRLGSGAYNYAYGGQGSDVIHGGDGNDRIYGDGPNAADEDPAARNVIYGGAGDDSITGGAGADERIYGGVGNDNMSGVGELYGEDGNDSIGGAGLLDGGAGDDGLHAFGTTDSTLLGGAGNDNLRADRGDDHLDGGTGRDNLSGGMGNDVLIGHFGDSALNGDLGDDRLVVTTASEADPWALQLHGDGGVDVVDFSAFSTALTLDLSLGNAQQESGAGIVTITGVENLIAGSGDDRITGSSGANVLTGGDGDDVLAGGLGDDTLNGGAGNDTADYSATAGRVFVNLSLGSGGGPGEADVLIGIENLIGGGFDDRLEGGSNANVLTGGGGNDAIIGGDGYDVSGYAGARKGYATVNSTTVVGGREGGTDTLTGIEAAAFVDGLTTFNADSQAAQLMRLYSAAFDRAPDAEGFHVQLDALEGGVSMAEMARRFLTSDEFVSRFGTLTDIQYVQRLYQNAFDRAPSNAEINDWLAYLNAGNTRQALMLVIAESAESRAATWSTLSGGLWVGDAVTESLARMFDTVFDRLPDENGLVTWRASMAGGATLLDVATAFLASAEGQARYGGLSNAQFVEAVYQAALNRTADAGGLAAYTAGLNAGTITRAQMLAEVSESAEHRALYLPNLVGGVSLQAAAPAPVETGPKIVHDEAGPQVLPGLDDDGKDDDAAGPQTVPVDPDASGSKDAGPQILPGLDADAGSKEDGAQVLPGLPDDAGVSAKDAGPQVLPGLADDDAFLPMPAAEAGREWAGLSARLDGEMAHELPAFAAEDFLPVSLKDAGPQVLPAETGLDLDALFEASPAELALEEATAALTPDPLKPTALPVEDGWHQLPTHDAFQ